MRERSVLVRLPRTLTTQARRATHLCRRPSPSWRPGADPPWSPRPSAPRRTGRRTSGTAAERRETEHSAIAAIGATVGAGTDVTSNGNRRHSVCLLGREPAISPRPLDNQTPPERPGRWSSTWGGECGNVPPAGDWFLSLRAVWHPTLAGRISAATIGGCSVRLEKDRSALENSWRAEYCRCGVFSPDREERL